MIGVIFEMGVQSLIAAERIQQESVIIAHLEMLVRARVVQDYVAASNSISRVGTNVVPRLLDIVRTNCPLFDGPRFTAAEFLEVPAFADELSLQVALGCRVIGDHAEPVFRKLTNQLFDNDWNRARVALEILINVGPRGLTLIFESFASSNGPTRLGKSFESTVCQSVQHSPRLLLPALVGVYERGDQWTRDRAQRILRKIFSGGDLFEADVDTLMPLFVANLENPDRFIRSQVLVHLALYGTNMSGAVPYVEKRLNDGDPATRSAATNTLRSIQPRK